jgi:hypothetical protein
VLAIFTSIVGSLIPVRYRKRFIPDYDDHTVTGATISGFIQSIGILLLIMVRFIMLINERAALAHQQIFSQNPDPHVVVAGGSGSGIYLYMEYMTQPLTLVLWYFAFEGAIRLYAAVVSREILPTLPLQAIAWIHGYGEKKKHDAWLGPLIIDEVRPGDGKAFDLEIRSCRPREWSALHTISYEDVMYEVAKSSQGEPPRRFIYQLRKAPAHKLVRGLHYYRPDELLESQSTPEESTK